MTFEDQNPSVVSVGLDIAHQEMLNLPSLYHDTFLLPNTPHNESHPQSSDPSIFDAFLSFIGRFRYSKVPSDAEQAQHRPKQEEREDDDDRIEDLERQRKPKRLHWSDYEETPADSWFAVLFLLLLLSLLFNAFLIFNGPPNGIPRHPKPKDNPLPHKGFRFQEYGRNYTCFETHTNVFKANYEFSNTFGAYDYLWAELQGKSNGVVYTKLGRIDGKDRRAGLAMFHQLDCLNKVRSVIQALQNGEVHGNVDVGEHHGYWPHCLDYLRQVILCNADDSLEVSEVVEGRWVTSGFGSAKECRDNSWLYDVTGCGEGGCPGKPFFHEKEVLRKIHMEEEQALEEWTEHGSER